MYNKLFKTDAKQLASFVPRILANNFAPLNRALCVQGIMRPELKQKLEKQLSQARRKSLIIWFAPLLILIIVLIVIGAYSDNDDSSFIVNGFVVSQHANLHDEGHSIYLMVKVPDKQGLAKVFLPKYLPIKLNIGVELRKKSTLFGFKFTFVRYIE